MTTRIRVRTNPVFGQFEARETSWTEFQPGTVSLALDESITDEVTPGYFKARREGSVLPVNPLMQVKRSLDFSGKSDCRWMQGTTGIERTHFRGCAAVNAVKVLQSDLWNPTNPPVTPPAAPLLQKALADARSQGWDVMTFAAEFHKTAKMVTRAGKTYERRAKDIYERVLKYRSRSDQRRLLEIFSETWLEYRYGWRILMYDLRDAQGAVERFNESASGLTRATVVDRVSINNTISRPLLTSIAYDDRTISGSYRGFDRLIQDESETIIRCGVGLEGLNDAPIQGNAVVTAYELVPYSFIFDWFFNLGEAVGAWAPFMRGSVAYAFTKVERSRTRVLTATPVSRSNSPCIGNRSPGVMVSRVVETIRTPATPTLDLRFRVNLDKSKVTDIVALVLLGHFRRMKGLSQRR